MRRALFAASGLVVVVTLLLSLKSAPGATRPPEQVPADHRPAPRRTSAPPVAGGGPQPTPGPSPSSAPPGSLSPAGWIYIGDSAYTDFGYVTVQITVADGRIADVTALEMPADEARSVTLSARVAPILRERALAAQSASFDTVSGATWTSEAYQESLRSALAKAGRT